MIPDEAVEAAAKAFIEHGTLLPALEAAAPHLMAAAWDECVASDTAWINPYRKAASG